MRTLRVLVAGMVAADPYQGGATWSVLQYALGLRELGHDVELVDPVEHPTDETRAYLAATGIAASLGRPQGREFDVLLNLSGRLAPDAVPDSIPIRVYLDLDPVFTQLWHLDGVDVGLDGHTHFASIGTNLPATGHEWLSFLPPVALAHWQDCGAAAPVSNAFTTIGNWRAYGSVERDGVHYGQKAHSLRGLFGLPAKVAESFELALSIHEDESSDLARLAADGWRLVDPRAVAGMPRAYRAYVAGSRAEFGVAKSGYVAYRSGWFSDRSACYLASGRPVLAQDTGFGARLPTGAGLFSCGDEGAFADAADRLRADYGRHARAARAIAEEFLDARQVLARLLDQVGAGDGARQPRLHGAHDDELADALDVAKVLARRPSPYRSGAPLLELDVALDGDVEPLVVKDVSPTELSDSARRAKAFLADPLREIVVYRDLLDGAGLGTPRLRATVVDERTWLALERVEGTPLEQVGDIEVWEQAFRWLARLHDRFRGTVLPPRLARYDSELLVRLGGTVAAASAEVRAAAGRLGRVEPTLLHGDLYPANVLVAGARVCVLDWELAGAGAAVLDVASLSTGWDAAVQERLVESYRVALAEPPARRAFERDLALARLVIAARFVAARDEWSPPPEHAHDFASDLARLGVTP